VSWENVYQNFLLDPKKKKKEVDSFPVFLTRREREGKGKAWFIPLITSKGENHSPTKGGEKKKKKTMEACIGGKREENPYFLQRDIPLSEEEGKQNECSNLYSIKRVIFHINLKRQESQLI